MNKLLFGSKKFKTICALVVTVIAITGIAGITAKAQTERRASNIKSKGIFDYDNGTVVVDASDLTYLADEIDLLEETYKKETVRALNEMNTYFMLDDSTTHDPDESNLPLNTANILPFKSIINGILASQSIPTEKTYTGTLPGEENETTGNISAATAESLSLGTAAWVDGELIVGTGGDNNTYYNQGQADISKSIYENTVHQESFSTVSVEVTTRAVNEEYSNSNNIHRIYNIPLLSDKFLYAVQFNLSEACSSARGGSGSGKISVQLKTVEGTVIGQGSRSGSSSDGNNSNSSGLVVVDLLASNFSTSEDYLILDITGEVKTGAITNADSFGIAKMTCSNILAKYK